MSIQHRTFFPHAHGDDESSLSPSLGETMASMTLDACTKVLPVSVVIPAYNAAEYLAAAVASVRAQSMAPEEIIVVDDGSSDGTADIARALGVTVHEQSNSGVSRARNTGVQLANMPWVAFLDADDLWEPTKLERQWHALQIAPNALMSITGSSYFNEFGELPGGLDAIPDFHRVALLATEDPAIFLCERESYALTLAGVNFIVHASIVVSRDVFLATGGYDETMRYSEDLDWILRAATLTPVALVKEPLTKIRTHTTNSSRQWDRMILSHIAVGVKAQNNPERYPAGVVAEFVRLRPTYYINAGMCLLRGLSVSEANTQFLASWKQRPNVRAGLMLAATAALSNPVGARLLSIVRNAAKRRSEPKDRA